MIIEGLMKANIKLIEKNYTKLMKNMVKHLLKQEKVTTLSFGPIN